MTTDHTALIEKLRGLTGPDREVDDEICLALNYVSALRPEDGHPINLRLAEDDPHWLDYEVIEDGKFVDCTDSAAELTASADACLALVERMLPGWTTRHHTASTSPLQWHFYCCRHVADREGAMPPHGFLGIGPPPIAILIALLTALSESSDRAIATAEASEASHG